MNEPYKFLALSDSVLTITGFGNVTKELCKRLSKNDEFEVNAISWNYNGQPIKYAKMMDGEEFDFNIYPGGRSAYAQDVLPEYLQKVKPDIFWILLDTFMLFPWFLDLNTAPAKTIFYFPSDGGWFPANCEMILKKVDYPVCMSKFGQKQLADDYGVKTDYIPHGVNSKNIYRLPDEQRLALRDKYGIPRNAFVCGDVARNQGRKMLAFTIMAFAEFAKDKPEAILFMHTDPNDNAAHSNLGYLAKRYGVENRVMFSGMKFFHGHTYQAMNEIYNLMDIRISTTTGEGFGICTIEAMSAEVPQVMTDYTTTKELILDNKCGLGAKVACEVPGTWDVYRGMVDIKDFADQMTILYNDRNLMRQMGINGRNAVLRDYDWDTVVGPAWINFLTKVAET